eukprot:4741606-Amphidinium_carterae.1
MVCKHLSNKIPLMLIGGPDVRMQVEQVAQAATKREQSLNSFVAGTETKYLEPAEGGLQFCAQRETFLELALNRSVFGAKCEE